MILKMKKVTAGMLTVLMLMSLVATAGGCQKKEEKQSPAASTQTKEEQKPVKLTWYTLGDEQADESMVYDAANKIIKDKINATVDIQRFSQGDYQKKMQLKVASNEDFDLCFTSDWAFKYSDNVAKGAFLELDSLIDKYAPDTKKLIPNNIWGGTKVNGKIYGIPNYQVSYRQPAIIFKKDLVDKYNLKDQIFNVKRLEDLTPIMDIIKKNEKDIYPTSFAPRWSLEINNKNDYVDQIHSSVKVGVNYDLKLVDILNDSKYLKMVEDAYTLSRSWYEKGFYHKDVVTIKDFTSEKKAGKFFILEAVYMPGVEASTKATYGYDVYAVPLQFPVISTGSVTATLNAVSKTSKNPERAVTFINLLNTNKELYNMLVFGIENKHYKKTGENRIEVMPQATNYSGTAWALGCQFNAYFLPGQSDDVWESTKKLNQEAVPAPTLGFVFDASPVKTIIANIDNASQELRNITDYGILDVNEWKVKYKEMADKINKAGMEDYKKELQKQLDDWKKANGK